MMWNDWGHGPGWFGMGWGMLLFWGVLLVLVVMLLRTLGSRRDAAAPRRDALEILAQRYARGEIDAAEYDKKRRDLSDDT